MALSQAAPTPLTVNQARLALHLWDYAKGSTKPPLLFLHGFMDTARSFDDLASSLASDFRPLVLGWRGHGVDDWAHADAGYHQLDHLRDLLCVLQELAEWNMAPKLVVAHSMGGTLGLMAAAFAPALVPRLLLLDCLGGYAVTPETRVEQMQAYAAQCLQATRPFRSFGDRTSAIARIRHNNPGLSEKGAERMARHYFREAADGSLTPVHDPRLRGPNPYRFSEQDWLAILAAVSCPVHVIAPEHGYLHRHDTRARFQALGQASWQDVAAVGHHVHVECPELVAQAVCGFS